MSPDAAWTFAPGVLIGAGGYLALYGRRWWSVRRSKERRPGAGRLIATLLGLAALIAALVSPIDRLGEQLLVMHMVQHVLLLDVVPILLILGLTKVLMRPVTRQVAAIEKRAGFLAHPVFAVVFYAGSMLVWHIPALYDAAVRHTGIHVLEHITFSAAGFLYWWHLLSPIRARKRLGGLGPITYMAATKLIVGLLGIVLTFAPDALYDVYKNGPHYWGLTPHEDQQLAGLVMALEQSLVMGIALTFLFVRMLGESERDEERAERFEPV